MMLVLAADVSVAAGFRVRGRFEVSINHRAAWLTSEVPNALNHTCSRYFTVDLTERFPMILVSFPKCEECKNSSFSSMKRLVNLSNIPREYSFAVAVLRPPRVGHDSYASSSHTNYGSALS